MTWTPKGVFAPFLLDQSVKSLIDVFVEAGHGDDFRFVGGCVRNILMNIPQSDIDIATKMHPELVRALFEAAGHNVHDTGIEHGTVTVTIRGEPYEITTLRRDVETDGRRAVIAFTDRWEEDAQRRDFRCNAIYMDRKGMLFDPVSGGIRDAMDRKLVFVGNADMRIREDYLRVLRFFRFQATLDAQGDAIGLEACTRLRAGMSSLSGERIQAEMLKLLKSANPVPAISSMIETGVYDELVEQRPCMDTFARVCEVSTDPEVRLAALFDWNDVAAERTLERWKVSRALSDRVVAAVEGGPLSMDEEAMRAEVYKIGAQRATDRLILGWAETPRVPFAELSGMVAKIIAAIPVFPIRGADVVAAGVRPGPAIGETLREIEAWWIGSGYPDRDACLARLNAIGAEA